MTNLNYEPMPTLGVYPSEPSRNETTNKFDWAIYVPSTKVKQIPLRLQFGEGVYIRSEASFDSPKSGQWEVPFVVSGPNPNAVRIRAKAVFNL